MSTDASARLDAVRRALDAYVAPLVARDGGTLTLLGVREGVVEIALGGKCQGCPAQRDTAQGVVLPAVRAVDPSVTAVRVVRPRTPTMTT